MILNNIEAKIDKPGPEGFIYPQYDGYCFSNIPSLASYLFGLITASPLSEIAIRADLRPVASQKVIVFLVDGFGFSQWLECTKEYDFLRRLTANGVVSPITAVFPSTTAASVTTIHSGLTPQEHGLLEWWVYFRELGRVIVTLPFQELGGKVQDELLQSGIDPKILFDGQTWYGKLTESGIRAINLIQSQIAYSGYSSRVLADSEIIPFSDLYDLMKHLLAVVSDVSNPVYVHVYWGEIDSAAHMYGVKSPEYLAEVDKFFSLLSREFLDRVPSKASQNTTIIVTADHGQISVDPARTLYLNEYSELVDCLRIGRNGERILPWGSARDVFMNIESRKIDQAFSFLSHALEGEAKVVTSEEALRSGLFGRGQQHSEFKSRIGDILILPYGDGTFWYKRPYEERFKLRGMHGGLSTDEMIVPLAVARLVELTRNR